MSTLALPLLHTWTRFLCTCFTVFIIITLCNWWSVPQLITASTYIQGHILVKLSWKDWITFAIFISCVPSATVKFCFFLSGYNSSWSVVCSCQLCQARGCFLLVSKIPSYLNFLLEWDLDCNAIFLIFISHILVFHFYFLSLLSCKQFGFLWFLFFRTFFSVICSDFRSGLIKILSMPPEVHTYTILLLLFITLYWITVIQAITIIDIK